MTCALRAPSVYGLNGHSWLGLTSDFLSFLVALDDRRVVRCREGIQLRQLGRFGTVHVRWISERTAFADVGMTPAWAKRASVVRDTNSLGSPEASITAYTVNPAALASSAGNVTQTLVQTPP